jgi:DNA segregation ATPase FtsK/SpoIIIE, S-DNA-T family
MRLKLSVQLQGARVEDLWITADSATTVGDIAKAIDLADPKRGPRPSTQPLTLRIDAPEQRVVPGATPLQNAGVQSGQRVALVVDNETYSTATGATGHAATLTVIEGPDKGSTFPLRLGSNQVGRGRGNDVKLTDALVSKAHVRINVGEQVDVVDLGSANGVSLRGSQIDRAVLGQHDTVGIGNSVFSIVHHASSSASAAPAPTVLFNRSPVLDPEHAGEKLDSATPPPPVRPGRFPMIPLLAPVLMGSVMFLITKNPTTVVFVALSPLMIVGSFFENRVTGKKAFETGKRQFRSELKDLEVQLHFAVEQEGEGRRKEYPQTLALLAAVQARSPMLWSRRVDKRAFLQVRLGLGTQPSRTEVNVPEANPTTPELWRELKDVVNRYRLVQNVPIVADLHSCGSLGISGPASATAAAARSAVLQITALHSPAEVVLCAMISPDRVADWEWLKWLPHTTSDHSPLGVDQIAVSSSAKLVTALEDLIRIRLQGRNSSDAAPLPAIIVLVDDAAPMERNHLVEVMENGIQAGVHMIWVASATALVPAACRTFIEFAPATNSWAVGDVRQATSVEPVDADLISVQQADEAARRLAPIVDAGAVLDDSSGVPSRVSFLNLVDAEIASSPKAVIDQWRASKSLPSEYPPVDVPQPKSKDNTLRAYVGGTTDDPFVLDLREHGPHALVGGTTGAGKSEFLQTWVLGMASSHSPDRVNFLFVDYKGGAAFAECTQLPHCVGMVTDLSPYLVRRALVSLKAELKYREELLHRNGKAKDLLELEKRDPGTAPPSLIIVVDEFAALAKEMPEFVDGVVDVAQRGRSLGLHLILATQRPQGVIRDNLRANTNLRVALRMADEDDSQDVVGSKASAFFDPSIPGRGIAKLGPGRLTTFQTGYVGGWTTNEAPIPVVLCDEFQVGGGGRWEHPVVAVKAVDPGPNDLKRIVATIGQAAIDAKIPSPRKPWQPELALAYELAKIRPSRNDIELIFGTRDDPENQRQIPVSFFPDRDGNMAVYGTGGSGKSTFLRTLAIAAGTSLENPCHVYGLDFGSRGLAMLEPLDHVGAIINGDDTERIERLLRMLRLMVDDRTERWAQANSAASIVQYRSEAKRQDEPRVLILIDNFGALRTALETSQRQASFDLLQRLIAEGRPLGIHFVMTADRSITIPPSIMSSVQRRLTLRIAQDSDYVSMGVPNGQLSMESPPGRGSIEGAEVQVAVLGGVASTGRQSAALQRLALELKAVTRWVAAPEVPRMPDEVRLVDLPVKVKELPSIGLSEETLEAIGFETQDPFLLIGPPQARPEQTLLTMVQSFKRQRPIATVGLMSLRRSSLTTAYPWITTVCGADEIKAFATTVSTADRQVPPPTMLAIDGITDLANSDIDFELQALLKSLIQQGVFMVALGDSFQISSAYGSAKLFKSYRNGLAILPEQMEGDAAFSTPFPRVSRSDFRQNCGYLVRQGRITKVLAASPT